MAGLVGLAVLAGLTGCSSASGAEEPPKLSVRDPYIPRPASTETAAGYLTVANTGDRDDRLVGVVTDVTEQVTLHRSAGGSMRRVDGFDIPADGTLRLDRGGNHLMLDGLTGRLEVGQKVNVELRFATSDPIRVAVPVTAMTYRPPGTR